MISVELQFLLDVPLLEVFWRLLRSYLSLPGTYATEARVLPNMFYKIEGAYCITVLCCGVSKQVTVILRKRQCLSFDPGENSRWFTPPANSQTDQEVFASAPQLAVTYGRGTQGCCCRSQGQLFVTISVIEGAQQGMLLSPQIFMLMKKIWVKF